MQIKAALRKRTRVALALVGNPTENERTELCKALSKQDQQIELLVLENEGLKTEIKNLGREWCVKDATLRLLDEDIEQLEDQIRKDKKMNEKVRREIQDALEAAKDYNQLHARIQMIMNENDPNRRILPNEKQLSLAV
jgi:hypothetical protein